MDDAQLVAARLSGTRLGAPASSLVVVEWTDAGGGADPPGYVAPLHVHDADDEAWIVLDGALSVRLDDRVAAVAAGGAVLCPRGTVHTWWNPAPAPARYVLVMTPRIERLIDALHALTDPGEDAIARVFAAYRSRYLGWPG